MSDLPEPLTPPDCDLRGLPFMPLDVVRLVDSDLMALSTGDEFKAAVTLWCKSWLQVPAASLPDDDRILAHLSGAGSRWAKVKKMALHGFVRSSDGRFYHPVVAEKAIDAWARRHEIGEARDRHAEKMRRWREAKAERSRAKRVTVTSQSRDPPRDDDVPSLTGTGTGTGRGREVPSSPSFHSGEEVSPPDGDDPIPGLLEDKKPEKTRVQLVKPASAEASTELLWEMARAWNEQAIEHEKWPQIEELTDARKKALRARIRERWAKDTLQKWRSYVSAIASTPFLRGENDRGWRANFDWAIRPDSPVKVFEGRYSNEGAN